MEQQIPLFPLSLVVYPGEKLKLHIFEPRYRQLTHECIESGITFGIPPVLDKSVANLATEVKLVKVDRKYSSGEMDITTEGVRRLKVVEFFREAHAKPYPGGLVSPMEDIMDPDPLIQEKVSELLSQLHSALGIQKQFENGPKGIISYDVAHQVGFNLEQELQLLSIDRESERMGLILEHLEKVLPVVLETERLKAKAKLNGHYKNILPPDF